MTRVIIAHSHIDIEVFEFISAYVVPTFRTFNFNTVFSEMGNYSTIIGGYTGISISDNERLQKARTALKGMSNEASKFYRNTLFPTFIKNNLTVIDISFVDQDINPYPNSKEYMLRDKQMFKTVFSDDKCQADNALVLTGLKHARDWHYQYNELAGQTLFVVLFSNSIHGKFCTSYASNTDITAQECLALRQMRVKEMICDVFKGKAVACTLDSQSSDSHQECLDEILDGYRTLIGEQAAVVEA